MKKSAISLLLLTLLILLSTTGCRSFVKIEGPYTENPEIVEGDWYQITTDDGEILKIKFNLIQDGSITGTDNWGKSHEVSFSQIGQIEKVEINWLGTLLSLVPVFILFGVWAL